MAEEAVTEVRVFAEAFGDIREEGRGFCVAAEDDVDGTLGAVEGLVLVIEDEAPAGVQLG